MNLILASSAHAKHVFETSMFEQKDKNTGALIRNIKLEKPVEVLFEGVDLNKYFYIAPEELPKTQLVSDLNTIKESFNYLYVGHWIQGDLGQKEQASLNNEDISCRI